MSSALSFVFLARFPESSGFVAHVLKYSPLSSRMALKFVHAHASPELEGGAAGEGKGAGSGARALPRQGKRETSHVKPFAKPSSSRHMGAISQKNGSESLPSITNLSIDRRATAAFGAGASDAFRF